MAALRCKVIQFLIVTTYYWILKLISCTISAAVYLQSRILSLVVCVILSRPRPIIEVFDCTEKSLRGKQIMVNP